MKRKRTNGGRQNGFKKQRSVGPVTVRIPRGLVLRQPEVKHLDFVLLTAVTSSGVIELVNGVLIGTSNSSRIGNKIHIHKVMIRGFSFLTDTTDDGDVVRLLLVEDRSAAGTTPTVANVLDTVSTSSFKNQNTMNRFNFIWDHRFAWDSRSVAVENPPTTFVQKHTIFEGFKRTNIVTEYTSSVVTFAAISTSSIFLLSLSNEAGAITISGRVRISYTDV